MQRTRIGVVPGRNFLHSLCDKCYLDGLVNLPETIIDLELLTLVKAVTVVFDPCELLLSILHRVVYQELSLCSAAIFVVMHW